MKQKLLSLREKRLERPKKKSKIQKQEKKRKLTQMFVQCVKTDMMTSQRIGSAVVVADGSTNCAQVFLVCRSCLMKT
ncbi:hypothetical protein HOLleu_00553 [Holothuria leucospilota]|uniref:Uncharacterized protein n=1 Tax=Holothuria leucospilota TaxID=206669 RepID=A0A9Q1HJR6_HOLLE|nr:hypothetical protein HOLleu_00553 [Holothuria leucospilota]